MVAHSDPSQARLNRRAQIVEAARALVGCRVDGSFDAARDALCAIDVVMVAGSPWLKQGIERDFARDEAGYRKVGGGANTPAQNYFFRSTRNLAFYLKRAGFYTPRGTSPQPVPGMACFWDPGERGRFNFSPGLSGVVIDVCMGRVSRAVLAERDGDGFVVRNVILKRGSDLDRRLIGYSDLP